MSPSTLNGSRCISLFSGAGGLDIGFERAGFSTVSLCELELQFAETLRQNQGWLHCDGHSYFVDAAILQNDIREVTAKQLTRGETVDCLLGGPPCQAFSSSGKQKSVLDPRGSLVSQFVRMVEEVRPRSFLFENVRGIVTARDQTGRPGGVIRKIISDFEELGYSCRAGLLNAADYGAFQRDGTQESGRRGTDATRRTLGLSAGDVHCRLGASRTHCHRFRQSGLGSLERNVAAFDPHRGKAAARLSRRLVVCGLQGRGFQAGRKCGAVTVWRTPRSDTAFALE